MKLISHRSSFRSFARAAFGTALGLSLLALTACGTGKGGGLDRVTALFDPSAETRSTLRDAAEKKYEPSALLIAAHNEGQKTLAAGDQRMLVKWWLGENHGVAVEKIGSRDVDTVRSKWADLAQHRPESGTEAYSLWCDTMAEYEATFRAQAVVLRAVAQHTRENGTTAAMSPEQVSTALEQFEAQALAIESKGVNYREGAVTAALEPESRATVAAQTPKADSGSALTQRDVKDASKVATAAQKGGALGAGLEAAKVTFPKK